MSNEENIKNKILIPVVIVIAILIGTSAVMTYYIKKNEYTAELEERIEQTKHQFNHVVNEQASMLAVNIDYLAKDPIIQQSWIKKDSTQLINYCTPIFNHIKTHYSVTNFYFIDVNDSCFLRIHNRARKGGFMNKTAFLFARKNKKPAFEIELGKGSYTLHYAYPWYIEGNFFGYIMLGMDINHLLKHFEKPPLTELVVIAEKKFLVKEIWEKVQKKNGLKGHWDDIEKYVVMGSTIKNGSNSDLSEIIEKSLENNINNFFSFSHKDELYKIGNFSMINRHNENVGKIIVIKQVTNEEAYIKEWFYLFLAISIIAGLIIIIIFYILLSKIEKSILNTKNELMMENVNRKKTEFLYISKNEELKKKNEAFLYLNQEYMNQNEDLILAKVKAEESDRLKSSFLANMSHEIRTPLNAVIGYSDLLKDKIQDVDLKKYVNGIVLGGNNLLALINDILDISKIEAGQFKINLHTVSLNTMLHNVHEMFKVSAKNKKINFTVKYITKSPTQIIFDEIRLRQILINLIGNAIKFTDMEGSVDVEINCIKNNQNEYYSLILKVSDTGIGIAPDQFDKIFEAFKQQDGQSTRKYEGTGLGLAITSRLTNLLGGRILLKSELNKGSEFTVIFDTIKFPSESEIKALEDELIAKHSYYFDKQKVLIVDDDESNNVLFSDIFVAHNLDVHFVVNGAEALKYLYLNKVDIILLNSMILGTGEHQILEQIKKIDKLENTPVIAIVEASTIVNDNNYDFILKKPIVKIELLETISRLMANGDEIKHKSQSNLIFKLTSEQFEAVNALYIKAKRTKSIDDIHCVTDILLSLKNVDVNLVEYAKQLKGYCEDFEIEEIQNLIENISFEIFSND